jgi:23S rRNA (uracil1939-C5)-methyltransferase
MIRVEIERLAFGGLGVGRLPSGKVCFVGGVAPGEVAGVQVVRERSSRVEAVLVQLFERSPRRVRPRCPYFGRCGGCQFQHLDYELQLEIKAAHVADALGRIGRIPGPRVEKTRASPLPYGCRNRITVHTHGGKTGFYGTGSRKLVDVARCEIASEEVNARLDALRGARPRDGTHVVREDTGFRGFSQVNPGAAEVLLQVVGDCAHPGGKLLVDAYCGAGFFGHRLAGDFQDVVGIEWSGGAVRHARAAGGANEIYLAGDVAAHLGPAMDAAAPEDTTVLVDPPAGGLPKPVVELLVHRPPAKLIYVSCDPPAMARDLAALGAVMRFVDARPVDMFPQTAHIECVATMEKR